MSRGPTWCIRVRSTSIKMAGRGLARFYVVLWSLGDVGNSDGHGREDPGFHDDGSGFEIRD